MGPGSRDQSHWNRGGPEIRAKQTVDGGTQHWRRPQDGRRVVQLENYGPLPLLRPGLKPLAFLRSSLRSCAATRCFVFVPNTAAPACSFHRVVINAPDQEWQDDRCDP